MQKYIREYELKLSIITHDLMSKPQPTFSYPLETSTIIQPTNHFCIEYFFFIFNTLFTIYSFASIELDPV